MIETVSEKIAAKAQRLVAEGRVRRVKGHVYEVAGDHGKYTVMVSYAKEGTGMCDCEATGPCSHLFAACGYELANPYHPLAADFDPFEGLDS